MVDALFLFTVAAVLWAPAAMQVVPAVAASPLACWKDTLDRGVGIVPEFCARGSNTDRSGDLCYPPCKAAKPSFYGVGPVCWQHCEPGWVDEGALCRKQGSVETKAKRSYGRGAGSLLTCSANMTEDAALCYTPCPPAMPSGVGPVCWENCGPRLPVNGGALCCKDTHVCDAKLLKLSLGFPLALAKAALAGKNITKEMAALRAEAEALLGFVLPLCDHAAVGVGSTRRLSIAS
jgi:hypothetical protein